ncbi:MAG: transporter, partial [Cetobacterium sp.]
WVANTLNLAVPFTAREAKDLEIVIGLGAQLTITCGFFMSTKLFFKGFKSKEREASYNKFFNNISTEVIAPQSDENELDNTQRSILGKLIFAFGIILSMLVIIPNPTFGRITLLLIGLTNSTIGYFLNKASTPKIKNKVSVSEVSSI